MIEDSQSKIKFWSQHLVAAKEFDGSNQTYCDKNGLKLSTFYQWKREIEGVRRTRQRLSFLPAIVQESPREVKTCHLPEARWVAEVLAHLMAVTR